MSLHPNFNASSLRTRFQHASLAVLTTLLAVWGIRAASALEASETDPRRAAVVMLEGTAECTIGGVTKPADLGTLLPPGSTVKTGKKSEVVLFFRQVGTMVRLRPNTTLGIETMTKFVQDEVLLKETVLDLKEGGMMCVVRVLDERSKFEVKFPGYSATFDGAGMGRFDLNAKGTILVGKRSERSLRVVSAAQPDKLIMVPPGQYFTRGNDLPAVASEQLLKKVRPNLDKLESLARALTPPPRPEELPRLKRK